MNEVKQFKVFYDYTDAPTLKKFALSNKRVRCVMGPFGPLSNDSEYLGEYGWKRIEDYKRGEKIAQFNTNTNQLEFIIPEDYIVSECDYFYNFKGTYIDMMLSDNHRILWKKDNTYSVKLAQESAEDHWSNIDNGEIPNTFEINRDGFNIDKYLLRLQVAVISEGSFHKRKNSKTTYDTNGCVIGLKKERKKLRLEYLFHKSNTNYKKTDYEDGRSYYYFQAPIKIKKFDSRFWKSNTNQIKIILDELRNWDFHYSNGNTYQYSTTEKESADFIQYCFHSQGISVNINTRDRKDGTRKLLYRLNVNEENKPNKLYKSPDSVSFIKYGNGYKYCFKTSTGFFLARRNGRIFITGNSGKSSACVMEIIRRAHEIAPCSDGIRRSRWAVVRNTYNQLRDTTIKTFHDWFPPKMFGHYHVSDHVYYITKFKGVEIEILFRALDRPDQVSNLLSLELTGAWFNEVREVPKDIIEAMDGRIGRFPSVKDCPEYWHGIIMDTNPPDDDSYIYNQFEVIKPKTWEMFKQPSGLSAHAENLKHLHKGYYQNLAEGKDDRYVRVYVHGQYGYLLKGKPVFSSFRDNIHVANNILKPIEDVDLVVGFDFGLTPACLIGQVTPEGQLRILDELVSDGMGIQQFCINQLLPLLSRKYLGYRVVGFGDPAGTHRVQTDESTCFDVLHSDDIGLINVVEATTNSLIPRIGSVESFLNKMINGEPGFIISPNCKYIRKALNGGYHYMMERDFRGGQQEHKDVPAKNFSSHIADALQYLCLYIDNKKEYDKQKQKMLNKIKVINRRPASSIGGY